MAKLPSGCARPEIIRRLFGDEGAHNAADYAWRGSERNEQKKKKKRIRGSGAFYVYSPAKFHRRGNLSTELGEARSCSFMRPLSAFAGQRLEGEGRGGKVENPKSTRILNDPAFIPFCLGLSGYLRDRFRANADSLILSRIKGVT